MGSKFLNSRNSKLSKLETLILVDIEEFLVLKIVLSINFYWLNKIQHNSVEKYLIQIFV